MSARLAEGTRCRFNAPHIVALHGQTCTVTQNECGVWPYIIEFGDRSHIAAFTSELEPLAASPSDQQGADR